jgi:excisionase family DNA binding protein
VVGAQGGAAPRPRLTSSVRPAVWLALLARLPSGRCVWVPAQRLRFPLVTKSMGEDWLGVPAVAEELGVTMRTLYRILNFGELPCYRIGRVLRIRRADVRTFREQGRVEPEGWTRPFPTEERGEPPIKSMPVAPGGEEWLSVPRVAEMLSLKAATVRALIERGDLTADFTLPYPRPGSRRRSIRVRQHDLKAFIERSRVRPGELAHLYPQTDKGGPVRKSSTDRCAAGNRG